ncbi:MAG: acyl-CoA dehydrogenase family protein [Myxococcota bacterium]
MNFGFTEEQEHLRKTVCDVLADHASMKRVREVMEDPDASHDAALWRQMSELGWLGLAFPEAVGGAELSLIEQCIVLEELGRVLAPTPFLPTAIAADAILQLGSPAQRATWLPRMASGEIKATLALTEEAGDAPEAIELAASRADEGFTLSGRKLFVPDAAAADLLVVVARTGGEGAKGLAALLVPADAPGLLVEPMRAMDLLRPLSVVSFADTPVPKAALLGGESDSAGALEHVLDRARVMLCAESVGAAERCLEASVQYAKERVQFGKPIGVNQAIKHKCADMLFAVESARSITYYAAWAAEHAPDEAATTASMAKSYVSDAFRSAAADNIQIHGGVGFTWEYDCHLYFKRAKSNEAWLGDGIEHRERVARLLKL